MFQPPQKALFLDRDGVINVNHGYVFREEDCDFVDGIFDLVSAAQARGYRVIIVTNQSGIARSYYSQKEFKAFSRFIEHSFQKKGLRILQTLHCPHHPKFSGACTCRKPKPGMLFKAARRFHISLPQSIMVGDSGSDISCARAAGVGKAVLFKDPMAHPDFVSSIYPNLWLERSGRFYKSRSLSSISRLL